MLRSYLILGFRNIIRRKTASLINITGISIALAFALIVALYVQSDFSFDRNQEHLDELYHLKQSNLKAGIPVPNSLQAWHSLSVRQAIQDNLGTDIKSSRYVTRDLALQIGEKKEFTQITFVDPDFIKMFSFDFVSGAA